MLASVIAAGLLLAAGTAGAQAYKWVDAQGKVHFSDTPPPDRPAAAIRIKPQMPEDPAAVARQRDWRTQLEESRTRNHAEEKQARSAESSRKTAELRCRAARRELDTLQRCRRIYRTGDDGQREYLADNDRPALLQRAQERVERVCR